MTRRIHRLASLFVPLLLGGCAGMSEDACHNAAWEEVGYRDGERGAAESRASSRAEACAAYGVKLDRDAYMAGYERGLARYCTPQNAVRVALDGGNYGGVCPPEQHAVFARVFTAAQGVQVSRQRVAALEQQWRELEYRLDRTEGDEERRYLRSQLQQLDYAMRRERQQLYYAEANLRQIGGSAVTPWP